MTINVHGRAATQKQWWHDTSPLIVPSLLTLNKGVRAAAVFYILIFSVAPSESGAWIQMEMRAGPVQWGSNAAAWEKVRWLRGWMGVGRQRTMKYLCRSTAWLWTRSGQGPDNKGLSSCRNIWMSNKRYYSFGRNQLKLGASLSGKGKGRTSEQYIVYLPMISITHFIISSNCKQTIG